MNQKVIVIGTAALIVASIIGYSFCRIADDRTASLPKAQVEFASQMRKLWEDHATWTRLFIVEAAAGLPSKDATAGRLLKNQEDIGNAIKTFYGDGAGNKLTALLKDHILGAAELLTAAKAGNASLVETAKQKWYTNAKEIAKFLSGANPNNWPLQVMEDNMKMHLDMTLNEAVYQLQGKYDLSNVEYDKIHEHILGLADVLSSGIIKQYPNKL